MGSLVVGAFSFIIVLFLTSPFLELENDNCITSMWQIKISKLIFIKTLRIEGIIHELDIQEPGLDTCFLTDVDFF